jgi:hypothetical protein
LGERPKDQKDFKDEKRDERGRIRLNQTESNQIKANQGESNQIKPSQTCVVKFKVQSSRFKVEKPQPKLGWPGAKEDGGRRAGQTQSNPVQPVKPEKVGAALG